MDVLSIVLEGPVDGFDVLVLELSGGFMSQVIYGGEYVWSYLRQLLVTATPTGCIFSKTRQTGRLNLMDSWWCSVPAVL